MEKTLYKISGDLAEAFDLIVLNEGEIESDLEAKIDFLKNELIKKADNVVNWVQYQCDLISLAKNRIEELKEFIKKHEKSLDNFDNYVALCMENLCTSKIEGELCSITKRKPSMIVEIYDENLISNKYIKIPDPKPTIDKEQIKKDLKEGLQIEGARLIESTNISITYKTK